MREGDTIIVHKAGDVIPEVVGPVLDKRPADSVDWRMPGLPVCGRPVVHEDGEVAYRCVSIDCPAQLKGAPAPLGAAAAWTLTAWVTRSSTR